jgi:hypothetical protein
MPVARNAAHSALVKLVGVPLVLLLLNSEDSRSPLCRASPPAAAFLGEIYQAETEDLARARLYDFARDCLD